MNLCIAIVGPTASGKSSFALEVAKVIQGEIVCLDSTTVYRGFDIGTAKPTLEARKTIPHHLLDIADPEDEFTAYEFIEQADAVISEIHRRGNIPIIVGGTNFYLKALQRGMYGVQKVPSDVVDSIENEYFTEEEEFDTQKMHEDLKTNDPKAAEKIHPNDRYRLVRALSIIRHTGKKPSELEPVPISEAQKNRIWLKYCMIVPRHQLTTQITARASAMIRDGLVEEAEELRKAHPTAKALTSIGYKESVDFLDGKIKDKRILQNIIAEKTRQLAKRQICWVRSDSEMRFIDSRDLCRVKLEIDNLNYARAVNPDIENRKENV